MAPVLKTGDKILISQKKIIQRGDIVAFYRDAGKNTLVIHRAIKMYGGKIFTKGDNSLNLDFPVEKSKIIGVVIARLRRNKIRILNQNTFFSRFWWLWNSLLFIKHKIVKNIISFCRSFSWFF